MEVVSVKSLMASVMLSIMASARRVWSVIFFTISLKVMVRRPISSSEVTSTSRPSSPRLMRRAPSARRLMGGIIERRMKRTSTRPKARTPPTRTAPCHIDSLICRSRVSNDMPILIQPIDEFSLPRDLTLSLRSRNGFASFDFMLL